MLIRASIDICSNHPLSGTETSAVSALTSLIEDDPAKDPHISSSPLRHHLRTDPFVAAKLPPTPISPPQGYDRDSPSRSQPLVQSSSSAPSSHAVRKQTSRSTIIADGPGQRSRTSKSTNVSGTLTQNTGSTSQLSQRYPPPQRQGTGGPSSKSSPLSSRTGTSSNATRRKLKCRPGEHDFERKFGVSISTTFVIYFGAIPLLNTYGYLGSRPCLFDSVRLVDLHSCRPRHTHVFSFLRRQIFPDRSSVLIVSLRAVPLIYRVVP